MVALPFFILADKSLQVFLNPLFCCCCVCLFVCFFLASCNQILVLSTCSCLFDWLVSLLVIVVDVGGGGADFGWFYWFGCFVVFVWPSKTKTQLYTDVKYLEHGTDQR